MTTVLGASTHLSALPSNALTVPAGVTTTMVGLIVLGTAQATLGNFTISRPGATVTRLDARPAGNMSVAVFKITGVIGGDTLTVSSDGSVATHCAHFYQDEVDFVAGSLSAVTRGTSVATCLTGSVTAAAGQRVFVVGLERTTATPTTVLSVTTTAEDSITQVLFQEQAAQTATSMFVGSFDAGTAGARTATVTYNSPSGNGYGALVLAVPLGAAPSRVQWVTEAGTLAPGTLRYTSTLGVLTAPVEVRAMPAGYPSVTAMLAQPTFYCGHRGGSSTWPEMSLHAYTQAAYWGVGALEVSVARTLDGHFIGLHDETLDRTSGTTGYLASAHTWAEIQQFLIAGPAAAAPQPGRPYMLLEDLLGAYGETHVILIDPKLLGAADRVALLDLMDQVPGATTRLIAKFYGVSTAWPAAAAARGYQTWGYFYEEDLPSLPEYQGYWSILGMEHSASQTTWDTILSYGKPVMGHVIQNAAHAAAALSKGAHGLQVAAVTSVIPRTT